MWPGVTLTRRAALPCIQHRPVSPHTAGAERPHPCPRRSVRPEQAGGGVPSGTRSSSGQGRSAPVTGPVGTCNAAGPSGACVATTRADDDDRPRSQRALMMQRYPTNIAADRIAARRGGTVESVQLRMITVPIAAPAAANGANSAAAAPKPGGTRYPPW
ncbi:DUF5819 family protein [Streptomyces sp. NPDC047461]|uniref:DUF5819 family protein n=1 Tax=Streptomyces sp. NPDC047461 TaxID=3155619 RepID=UPI003400E90F